MVAEVRQQSDDRAEQGRCRFRQQGTGGADRTGPQVRHPALDAGDAADQAMQEMVAAVSLIRPCSCSSRITKTRSANVRSRPDAVAAANHNTAVAQSVTVNRATAQLAMIRYRI